MNYSYQRTELDNDTFDEFIQNLYPYERWVHHEYEFEHLILHYASRDRLLIYPSREREKAEATQWPRGRENDVMAIVEKARRRSSHTPKDFD